MYFRNPLAIPDCRTMLSLVARYGMCDSVAIAERSVASGILRACCGMQVLNPNGWLRAHVLPPPRGTVAAIPCTPGVPHLGESGIFSVFLVRWNQ